MIEERTGEAFEMGERLTVVGRNLRPGSATPDFALDHFYTVSMDLPFAQARCHAAKGVTHQTGL